MWNIKIKSERGITLAALATYIFILTLVLAVLTTISTFFYSNIGEVTNPPKYIYEFNNFTMFFATDIKNHNNATVSSNTIQFEEGPEYKFENNAIYRNGQLISKNVLSCKFTLSQTTVNTTTKNIINVNIQIGENEEDSMTESVDFTLKYW